MNALCTINIFFLTISVLAINVHTQAQMANNPVLWADVPDPDIIRVGETYYMTSTTMHFNPGIPIMKSNDLVTWETIGYVYNELADNNNTNLEAGQNMYGKGSWASCLRYSDGFFYVYFHSYTTNSAHAYRTQDIENGIWEHTTMGGMHDLSVLFDDDGKVWSVYGGPDVQIRELTADGLDFMPGTTNRTLIQDAGSPAGSSFIVAGEGAHIQKINGMYYVFIITWPQGSGRTQVVWRANSLNGPWEGRVVLNDNGVAQGQIVQTPEGKWYGLLFKDSGGVGRIPYLTNVTWEDGWPMMELPETLDIPATEIDIQGICGSDDFNYTSANQLSTIWQWNHNSDPAHYSFTDRPGYFRITTSRTDANIYSAKNSLTQRTFGPTSVGIVSMDVSHIQNGDFAGLSAFQDEYGFVGVKMSGGSKSIVMYNNGSEIASTPLNQNTIFLRANCNFQNGADDATFHYSLDGNSWTSLGNTVQMSFQLTHFCGYRFALFNYATQSAGGYVDFDYFKTGYDINNLFPYISSLDVSFTSPTTNNLFVAPATIPFDVDVSENTTISHIDFYINNEATPFHEEWTAPYNFEHVFSESGTYQIRSVAYDNDGNTDEDNITITVNVPQGPYLGTAVQIPGTIEFENFDVGGNGFAYYDTDAGTQVDPTPDFRTNEDVDIETCYDEGEGYNIGYAIAGEWLEYTVDVQTTGMYDITFRIACEGDDRTVSLESENTMLAEDVAIPNTGGWQTWTEVTVENVELQAGEQVLRLTIGDVDYVNLNYMTFTLQEEPVQTFELISGWNLIGCPLEETTNVETALQSIWTYVDMVKDMNGFFMKSNQAELNSLSKLSWGKGYLIYVNGNCTLTW